MDFKQISELIRLVGKSGLSEVKIEQDNFKITLKAILEKSDVTTVVHQAAPQTVIQNTAPAAPVAISTPTVNTTSEPQATATGIEFKSPMIGTFYRKPSPDKEVFVKVGDVVKPGDVLCMIEAMKLFNEIESEVSGKIVKILVDDSSPVEYDQPLFLIEPM